MINVRQISLSRFQNGRAYYQLCKPNVVALMLLTAIVGMCMASSGRIPIDTLLFSTFGIALVSASGAVFNHVCDRHYDSLMSRTKYRPLPLGTISARNALMFAFSLMILGTTILFVFVNSLTAVLTLLTMSVYAGVYTLFLKHVTSQNIVIGGAAGAAPPLLGWTAITGHFDPQALLLVAIIFTWTPPHFWALAIHRCKDYQNAKIPMLPVTHGIKFTKNFILLYTFLLIAVSLLPFVVGMSGLLYLFASLILGGVFIYYSLMLFFTDRSYLAIRTFHYSIIYLTLLFLFLLIDHYY